MKRIQSTGDKFREQELWELRIWSGYSPFDDSGSDSMPTRASPISRSKIEAGNSRGESGLHEAFKV